MQTEGFRLVVSSISWIGTAIVRSSCRLSSNAHSTIGPISVAKRNLAHREMHSGAREEDHTKRGGGRLARSDRAVILPLPARFRAPRPPAFGGGRKNPVARVG